MEAISGRQKLIVLREKLKSRLLSQPDAASFLQLCEVQKQLGEPDTCLRLCRQLPGSWRTAVRALHLGLGEQQACELLLELLSVPSTDDATRLELCALLGQLRPLEGTEWFQKAGHFKGGSDEGLKIIFR